MECDVDYGAESYNAELAAEAPCDGPHVGEGWSGGGASGRPVVDSQWWRG